jgi:60 kDa SS-A/Ro ribonucleoprotein
MNTTLPDIPMAFLTGLELSRREWMTVARRCSWQTLRMNLNAFDRRGVFEDRASVKELARRLADRDEIARARVLPYQLLAAWKNACGLPAAIMHALRDAIEIATENVPVIDGDVWVLPDVSGSMHSPVTGQRAGATTAVRCVDVAALVAACVLRRNPRARVLPFSDVVHDAPVSARAPIFKNAARLAALPAGGTDCSAPLRRLNEQKCRGDLVIFVSDNESWIDPGSSRSTAVLEQWGIFKSRNRRAKLVCIDLQPGSTTQAPDRADILNIGGFSDDVFATISRFACAHADPRLWTREIDSIQL